jgi:hypothetical protein
MLQYKYLKKIGILNKRTMRKEIVLPLNSPIK